MDYDDTEFQSQNFQLVEEDSSKFPLAVRSFTLPKLEFDEHFEVHLGFDSLVETESLRGMQGQVNNWIEDFSSGSSPVVFTSSAAESCSISRHNNVWSEVTSSESVEMLLKSVREEEMINGGAIVNVVDSHDQTVGIEDTKNSHSRNEDIGDIDPVIGADKYWMSDNLVQVHSEVDDLSQTSEGEKFCMELDAGSFGERLTSDRESHVGVCEAGGKRIASLGDTPDKGVQVGEDNPVIDRKENLGITLYDDHICVAEVHKETPVHTTCAQDDMCTVSMDNIIIAEEKFENEVVSEQVMEKHSDIIDTKKDAPLDDVSLKIELGGADVKVEDSEDHLGDAALCNGKESCLEADMDSTVLLRNEGCEPIISCNPDGLVERNKSSETGVTTKTEDRAYLAAECYQSSPEIGNEKSMNHTRRTFRATDVSHEMLDDVPKSGFYSKTILSVESTKQFDGYMEDGMINTFAEVIEENKNPECLKVENNSGHMSETAAEEVMLQSLNAGTHEAEEPKLKDGDSLTINSSERDLFKLASANVEKCTEGRTNEKEVTVDTSQSAILEKALSPSSGNHADGVVLTSSHDRSVEIFHVHKLVAEPLSNGITQGKSSSPGHTGPSIHPSSCTSDSDASIPADMIKILPSTIQNTPVLNIGGYLSANNKDHIESEEKETRSSLPAYSDEKIMSSSRNMSSSLVNSNAEEQPVNKSVSDPAVMDRLLEKEMMHGISEPKQKASSVSMADAIQLNESRVTCITFSKGGGKEQTSLSSSPVNDSGDTGHLREPAATGCIGYSKDRMEEQTGNKILPDQTGPSEDDQPWISSGTAEFANKVKPMPYDLKESTASDDGRSFACEVGYLAGVSEKGTPKHGKPVPSLQSFDLPQGRQFEVEEVDGHSSGTKTSKQDKIMPASGCFSEINITYSGKHTEERSSLKQTAEKDHNCSARFSNDATITKDGESEIMRQYSEKSDMSLSCLAAARTSGLPDLNSSTSAAVLLHQPFTDLQQVQLRAQIFVYGSLIQGTPPEEACMLSAFGEADGGRSLWEGVWHAAIERFQNLKAPYNGCVTTLCSSSGVKVPEQVARVNSFQSKASNSPICLSGTTVGSSATFTSACCPASLWSISTHDSSRSNMTSHAHLDGNQATTPLSSHKSSQRRKYTGNGAPLFSPSSHSGPVVVPSQSSRHDTAPQYSAAPIAVSLQVAPAGHSFVSHASNVQHGGISVLLHSPGSSSVSVEPVVQNEAYRKSGSTRSNKKPSPSQKLRKRKKATIAQELESIPPVPQSQTEPTSVSAREKIIYSAVQFPIVNTPMPGSSIVPATTASHFISPSHSLGIHTGGNTDQKAFFSEEACNKIEQAKLQAEDAAALASSAIRHKNSIWSELTSLKNSGLATELQVKLASAAAAAAAAASVAKAAAAAAKIASDAALQAKMMADEALDLLKAGNTTNSSDTDLDLGKGLTRLTPVMILEGKDKFQESSSVISMAREASRKRVEAASAATERAENLYAIVKAAELAAEAVSQAGILVAMGDPLPFTVCELAEAGPDNFWKVHISTAEKSVKEDSQIVVEQLGIDGSRSGDTTTKEDNNGASNHCQTCEISTGREKSLHEELPVVSEKAYSDLGRWGHASSSDLIVRNGKDLSSVDVIESGIKKDSLVEVAPDADGLRGVWFSAWVLDVKDGKAYICYHDLLPDEGSAGPLKEWISLEGNGDKAPRIRIAHPMSTVESGGTRKRRRETMGNFVWAVGDHVDAFIRDGWWEGMVTQKYKEDETKLTVHFPAGGDTSIVRSWNLRPSLIWKDGQWRQWSRPGDSICQLDEGDTPNEKRPKLSRSESCVATEVDRRENGQLSQNLLTEVSGRPEQLKPLVLSAKDRVCFAGKNSREENSSAAPKITQTGLGKEGSGAVFGVPRPGKRRKFIEVSKHYTTAKTEKASEVNDSIKLAQYLMLHPSRLSRKTSTVDPKRKRDLGSRPKLPRPLKSLTTQASNAAEKKNFCGTIGGFSGCGPSNPRPSSSSEDNPLQNRNSQEGCSSLQNTETSSQSIELPRQSVPIVPVQKSSSSVEADVGVNGNVIPAAEKSIRTKEGSEHNGQGMSEANTLPRRSNRRIQPTSRLLEGLQSSLIISKIPSGSRDKGARAPHRGGSSSRGKPRG